MNTNTKQRQSEDLDTIVAVEPAPRKLVALTRFGGIGVVLYLGTLAHAEGFRNPPPGAFDLGRAGGRIAQVDDSSSVQHNPANLVDLSGPEFQFTPSIVYIEGDYKSPNGQTATTQHPWKFLPNVFGSVPLFDGNAAIGLGVTMPYGLGNEWDTDSPAYSGPGGQLHYQAPYYANLQTINLNPTFS